jgi:hypothetical protein
VIRTRFVCTTSKNYGVLSWRSLIYLNGRIITVQVRGIGLRSFFNPVRNLVSDVSVVAVITTRESGGLQRFTVFRPKNGLRGILLMTGRQATAIRHLLL